ncbi:MAG: sigma-70 family RNA polymerase sigma factor [Burkholderiales bacterium]|nr:sigma-70 family RNA polymerase sigma factor [Burkholderiales bacterium]MDE1925940.1 sigma-70 family RNA polymerase sigma factor [Burkholderiales bacterium]MDE2157782.1 sigma-70 family RNA polymerase sigma factor [Burkholderiales bacterium]MDE2502535.1 sigma-70 family RNA polymerase sigma factor [Burkholderiales bacterium]
MAEADEGQPSHAYARLYPEIKRLAHARLARAGGVVGLNTTALVHEGFLRMAQREALDAASRAEFFAYVGQVLRSVVIDHLRGEARDKRGGEQVMVTLSAAENVVAAPGSAVDLVALDRALQRMQEIDPALRELIEAHAFAGLTIDEVARLRGVTARTINRELVKARALLAALLE